MKTDTVYVLIGKIGKENLSTHSKNRLKTLNSFNDELSNLQKAYEEADEKDKSTYLKKVNEKQDYLENYEEDFRAFLQVEYNDLVKEQEQIAKAKADAQAKAEADAKAKAEAEAQAKSDADAKAKSEAEAQAQADTDAKAKEEAEAEALRLEKQKSNQPPADQKGSKIGVGTIVLGAIIGLATFGTISYFKNK